jgi:hypothetical protein
MIGQVIVSICIKFPVSATIKSDTVKPRISIQEAVGPLGFHIWITVAFFVE